MSQKEEKLEIVQKYYTRKKDGEIDYEHPYDLIQKTKKGLYYVRLDGYVGYMNEKGEFVVPISYDYKRKNFAGMELFHPDVWYYYDGETEISSVYKNNRVGAINSCGEELVPCKFEDVGLHNASENFIPVALPSQDNSKLDWGMYDVKNKKVSVIPQYEEMAKEQNGYASFKENGQWGLLHCATGTVVIPAIYLIEIYVADTGIARAFFGGSISYCGGRRCVDSKDCRILVVNGIEPAQLVVSGYNWIESSGPSVMKCSKYNPEQEDSFKVLKMPNYIGIVRNATYEAGYFLKENGKFVKEFIAGCCTTIAKLAHARYISGGIFSAITYDGKSIPVTNQMKLEILKRISEE